MMAAFRRFTACAAVAASLALLSPCTAFAATYGVLNGPAGHPDASGDYGNSGTASQHHDFTAYVLNVAPNANNQYVSVNSGTSGSTGSGSPITVPSGTSFSVRNTLQNTGTSTDTFLLSVPISSLPAGWSVAFYQANADGSPNASAPITSATPPVAPSATLDYDVVYKTTAPVNMSVYYPYAATLRAASVNGGGGTNYYNDTQTVVFVNGFVQLTKSIAITANGCPALAYTGVPNIICSGGTMKYTIAYKNVMPPAGTHNVVQSAIGFTLSENGSGTDGWGGFTNGLAAMPADTASGTIACPGGICLGAQSFTDTLATLAPQSSGSVSFSVVVK